MSATKNSLLDGAKRTINASVPVGVSLSDHIINLGISQILANRLHKPAHLVCTDGATAVLVKNVEGGSQFGLFVRCLSLVDHHSEEL